MPRPREFDRDQVLDGAMELFWEKGFEGTSVGDLERALGIGRQSLYNTFGDKRALFVAALDRYVGLAGDMVADLRSGRDGLEAIRRYFSGVVAFLTPEGSRRGCMLTRSLVDHGEAEPEVAGRCEANTGRLQEGMERALQVAVERGEVPADLPVEATARMLVTQVYGLGVMARGSVSREELAGTVDALLARL